MNALITKLVAILSVIVSTIGWADEGSPSFTIDGLRTSAYPMKHILSRYNRSFKEFDV
jgi:hypothetical protein